MALEVNGQRFETPEAALASGALSRRGFATLTGKEPPREGLAAFGSSGPTEAIPSLSTPTISDVGGLARDVGLPAGAGMLARLAISQATPVGRVAAAGAEAAGEFGASRLRGDTAAETAAFTGIAFGAGLLLPVLGNRVLKSKRVPEKIVNFFRGERSVRDVSRKVISEADRVDPGTAASAIKGVLRSSKSAMTSDADKTLSAAANMTKNARFVPKAAIVRELDEIGKNLPTGTLKETDDAIKHAKKLLELESKKVLGLKDANRIRSQVGSAFKGQLGAGASEARGILAAQDAFDAAMRKSMTGITKDPDAVMSLLKQQRSMRTARDAIFSDKGTAKPNLDRLFTNENIDVLKTIVGEARLGDFNALWKHVSKRAGAEPAQDAIRSVLLDQVDELGKRPGALAKALNKPTNLLRRKLDLAFYRGFSRDVLKSAKDAERIGKFMQSVSPHRGIGSGQRGAFGALGGLAGMAASQAIPGGDPLTRAAAGGLAGFAAPMVLEGGARGLGALAATGPGRRAAAAGAAQGARALAQRNVNPQERR